MTKIATVGVFISFLTCSATACFGDIVVYTANFESGLRPAEFSGAGSVIGSGSFPAAVGLGSFVVQNAATGNPAASTNIGLTGLAAHSQVGLAFSFIAIDS